MTGFAEGEAPVLKPVQPLPLAAQQSFFIPQEMILLPASLEWLGREGDAVIYRARDQAERPVRISVFSIMSEDEKIIFRAFQDFYAGALRQASGAARGYYTFEILQFFVGDAPRSWSEFSELLTRHAAKQAVTERRLIQFGSLWGVLERHTEAEFGRVESKLKIDFFKPDPEKLAKKLKKIIEKQTEEDAITLFKDESGRSLTEDPAAFELFERATRPNRNSGKGRAYYWHPRSRRCLPI